MKAIGTVGRRWPRDSFDYAAEPAQSAAAEQFSEDGKPLCQRVNCSTEARSRGLCSKHYMASRRQQNKVNS